MCASLIGLHYTIKPGGQGSDLFFPRDEDGVAWYKLHRGGSAVLKLAQRLLEEGGVFHDILKPWKIFGAIEDAPLERKESDRLDEIASCWSNADLSSDDTLALEEALQHLRYIFSVSSMKEIGISASAARLSWCLKIPRRFCEMIDERCPQALVLVAVYCVLWKRDENHWWVKGKAENLLEAVRKELPGTTWDAWLEWPMEELQANGRLRGV